MPRADKSDDDWAAEMQEPRRHHRRAALKGQVALTAVFAAAVLAIPLLVIRALL